MTVIGGAPSNEVGGTVWGNVVQAHALTLQLPPPPPPPVPAQLPRLAVRRFVDRVDETARLTGWHTGQAGLVVLVGAAGAGKTTLALRWAAEHGATFVDGQLHVDFAAEPDLTGEVVVRRCLRALGVALSALPPSAAEQAALWRSLTHDRRLLLVLDGVRAAGQVLPVLPASPHALTVVTARRSLPDLAVHGGRLLPVDGLPTAAAVELLADFAGADRSAREPDHLERLAASCKGHPLTAVLLGGQLEADPGLSVAALAAHTHNSSDLPWRTAMDMAEGDLPDEHRTVLDIVRAVGGPGLTASMIGAVALPGRQVNRALSALVERGLLAEVTAADGEVRYRAASAADPGSNQTAGGAPTAAPLAVALALDRLVEYYTGQASAVAETLEPGKHAYSELRARAVLFADRGAARAWFDRERTTVLAVLAMAADRGMAEWAWQLGEATWIPLRSSGLPDEVLLSQEIAAGAAHELGHPYESAALARVAWAQTWLGRTAEAMRNSLSAVDLAKQHADDWALATALSTLARAMIADGRIVDGVATLEECIDLDVRISSPQWVIGLRKRHQAEAFRELHQLDRARAVAQTAVWLIASDPRPRRTEEARTRTVLAEILLDLELPQPAHAELLLAAELLDREADHVYRGEVHALLLHTSTALGLTSGERHRALAVEAFERAGHPQRACELRGQSTLPAGADVHPEMRGQRDAED